MAKWIVHGTLNAQVMGLSLSAVSWLAVYYPWARCELLACLTIPRYKIGTSPMWEDRMVPDLSALHDVSLGG